MATAIICREIRGETVYAIGSASQGWSWTGDRSKAHSFDRDNALRLAREYNKTAFASDGEARVMDKGGNVAAVREPAAPAYKTKKRGFLVYVPADRSKEIRREEFTGKAPAYEKLRDAVGGLIQPIKAKYEGRARNAYVNEEGFLRGLPYNARFSKMAHEVYGPGCQEFVGDAVIIFWETVKTDAVAESAPPNYKGGATCGMKLSVWLAARLNSHGISDHDALSAAFKVDFGTDAPWPSYDHATMARMIDARGKGGTLNIDTSKRYAPDHLIVEHFARTLVKFSPWQTGLGFRFRAALEALEKAGY